MKKLLNILEEIYAELEDNEELLEEEKANLAEAFFYIQKGFKYFIKMDRKYDYGININNLTSIKECLDPTQVIVLRQFVENEKLYDSCFGELYEMFGENPDGYIRLFKDLLNTAKERKVWNILEDYEKELNEISSYATQAIAEQVISVIHEK